MSINTRFAKILPILLIALFSELTFAQSVGTVDGSKFTIEGDVQAIRTGVYYFIKDADGKNQGVAKFESVINNTAHGILLKGQIQPGWNVEPVKKLSEQSTGTDTNWSNTGETPSDAGDKKLLRGFGVDVYYSSANVLDETISANGQTGTANANTSTSFGLGVFYVHLKPGKFGGLYGLDYEFSRNITSVTTTAGGNSQTVSGSLGSISIAALSANLGYMFTPNMFAYLGGNYGLYTLSGGANSQSTMSGSLGFQVGFGYRITDNIFASVEYRILNGSITSSGSASATTTFDGALLRAAYNF